tara:strand:+ start:959 stop:1867 length:909 start_codon:yes stop_codon:yes gene_type:complete
MEIILKIPQKIHNKYTYLLNRFKDLEWSGPAWYRVKTDDDGFPIEWRIVHFHPLNLGSHASTEWKAKDLANILKETYTLMPSLKKAYIGLIHSHNTMGAFLSGTDTDTIQEMAPDEGFYGSLVVASAGKALHAFGIGYKDQYKVRHCFKADEKDIKISVPGLTPLSEWISEANLIEKNKPKPEFGKQYSLLNGYGQRVQNITSVDDITKENTSLQTSVQKQSNSAGYFKRRDTLLASYTNEQKKKVEAVLLKWDAAESSDIETEEKLGSLGLSYTNVISLMDWTDDGGFSETTLYGGGAYGF